jgi:hypothetical protein
MIEFYDLFLKFSEPPKAANIHVTQTTANTLTIRWRVLDDGLSPINNVVVNYKMTYGEWINEEVGWHEQEHVLKELNCGREYHVYVVLYNALGASPASQVLTSRTLGNRPTAPNSPYDFILANTTFLSLRLDQWDDHNCEILYFVIEYKMASTDNWITVTNDLQPQARYSIRGLASNTDYELKVTAHNHAGSTSIRYTRKFEHFPPLHLNFQNNSPGNPRRLFRNFVLIKLVLLVLVLDLAL